MKSSFKSITVLVISISVALLLLCTSATTAQTRKDNKFIYDKKENLETVYTLDLSGKYLTPKIKYEYTRDSKGAIVEKKAYRWDNLKDEWMPYYQMTFTEDHSNTIIEFAQWDNKVQRFSVNRQKAIYNKSHKENMITYLSFQWDDSIQEWNLDKQLLLENYLAIYEAP